MKTYLVRKNLGISLLFIPAIIWSSFNFISDGMLEQRSTIILEIIALSLLLPVIGVIILKVNAKHCPQCGNKMIPKFHNHLSDNGSINSQSECAVCENCGLTKE
ncbi:MAG: hypothetical protein Q7I99_00835 [Acholeplasmataceae bacterium]|nr:hypothetical protein [Acholeplasmataceae bacterium]